MEYSASGDSLDRLDRKENGRISKLKAIIENTPDTREKEKYFKKIAFSILERHGFHEIVDGQKVSKRQGVPFDFLALKENVISLIELKGSRDNFNYSKEVQFARLNHVVNELKKRKIRHSTYLLQINLKYALYQILDSGFYANIFKTVDTKLGWDRPIDPIVDDIISTMRQMGIRLSPLEITSGWTRLRRKNACAHVSPAVK